MLSDNSQITCLWSPKPNFAHSWNSTPWHSTFSRLQVLSRQVQQDVLHLQHPPPPPPGLPGGGAGEENSALASPLLGHTWWLLQVIYPRIVNFCQFMSYMTFIIYQLHFFMKKKHPGQNTQRWTVALAGEESSLKIWNHNQMHNALRHYWLQFFRSYIENTKTFCPDVKCICCAILEFVFVPGRIAAVSRYLAPFAIATHSVTGFTGIVIIIFIRMTSS